MKTRTAPWDYDRSYNPGRRSDNDVCPVCGRPCYRSVVGSETLYICTRQCGSHRVTVGSVTPIIDRQVMRAMFQTTQVYQDAQAARDRIEARRELAEWILDHPAGLEPEGETGSETRYWLGV
jgi:hypothetical protein